LASATGIREKVGKKGKGLKTNKKARWHSSEKSKKEKQKTRQFTKRQEYDEKKKPEHDCPVRVRSEALEPAAKGQNVGRIPSVERGGASNPDRRARVVHSPPPHPHPQPHKKYCSEKSGGKKPDID